MSLQVNVISASNLVNLEKIGKSDPYVELMFQGSKRKSRVIENSLNPEWNEKFEWDIGKQTPGPEDNVTIRVKDYERIGRNRLMGKTNLMLQNAFASKDTLEYELQLYDHNDRPISGTISLAVTYVEPETDPVKETPSTENEKAFIGRQMPGEPEGQTEIFRKSIMGEAENNKKNLYQVRVKIIEARHLFGSNISPICQVLLFKESKSTKPAKSTSTPWWNDVFFFRTKQTPAELFSEVLEFKVLNARAFRSNTLIGCFQLDLGMIYGKPQHSILNKWLLLTNDDEALAGIKGYLKVSMVIQGPGDICPDFSVESDDEADDVESNLLVPSGVQLKPASFILSLYQATDLPRMDSGLSEGIKKIFSSKDKKKKKLADPYFIMEFAGNKVKSKTIYGTDNPVWNENLSLGFQFPSVCENLILVLKDWDRVTEDDVIATAHIPLSRISVNGENGFLPTFGPTWVNFYGAPREFSILNKKRSKAHKGLPEGSYRGRVLLSLSTELGSYPDVQISPMASEIPLQVQKFCRRRKFKLHAVFLDSTMVSVNNPVQFEISVGNFGNKFEDSFAPCPSTTPPTNAVYDGCQYYFLPWKETKPYLIVTSQWEDIRFRLETVNALEKIAGNLKTQALLLRDYLLKNEGVNILPDNVIAEVAEKIATETSCPLPDPETGVQCENDLDLLLRKVRSEKLKKIHSLAERLQLQTENTEEIVQNLESQIEELVSLTNEPQNSIPDVIIWMLSANKRIAFHRIPAHEILYSEDAEKCGKFCGRIQTIKLKRPTSSELLSEMDAVLRVKLWFGLEAQEKSWWQSNTDGQLTAFAETYENQVNYVGNWCTSGPLMTRPSWSDASGRINLDPKSFNVPNGWQFEGEWFVNQEPSMRYSEDAGRREFLEDVYENQTRIPGNSWTFTTWTDIQGDSATPRDEVELTTGWEWEDVWQIDLHRAVDEEGWEYTVEATLGGYTSVEKTYHLCRRRRWVRLRKYVLEEVQSALNESNREHEDNDGWEYSKLFNLKFRSERRKMDLVRRRRWHRKLTADDYSEPAVLQITQDQQADEENQLTRLNSPLLNWTFNEAHQFQLRVYLYQAKDLIAGDKTGSSDPYACVSFLSQSQKTMILKNTLCPTWNQALIFEEVVIYGNMDSIAENPPSIAIEVFDRDARGGDDFLGRTFSQPVVNLCPSASSCPRLTWCSLKLGNKNAGEILSSFELFPKNYDELPPTPEMMEGYFAVPSTIRPVLQRTAVEILCWGVRNMKMYEYSAVNQPSVEFECGGQTVEFKTVKPTKYNQNFQDPVLCMEMDLPVEEEYMPAMHVRVRDQRQFGRKPIVGTHLIKSLHQYRCEALPPSKKEQDYPGPPRAAETAIDIDDPNGQRFNQNEDKCENFDWWSKYYSSVGYFRKAGDYLSQGYDTLQVFPNELEKETNFQGFKDFLNIFPLKRGKGTVLEESDSIGELKGTLRVYTLPSDPRHPRPQHLLKSSHYSTDEDVTVRVYIVQAVDLAPKDPNGKADPYVTVQLGKKKVNNKKNYKPGTLNPVFGEMFELTESLSKEKDLLVSVWDHDIASGDEMIGQTRIDLENRYFTKYRATCGLPKSYHTHGPNQWRDCKTPRQILRDICILRNMATPTYIDQTTIVVNDQTYALGDFEKEAPSNPHVGPPDERLALYILNQMDLVPEHVESRSLFSPLTPELEQGKIQMWIDIFPKSSGVPGFSVDISPRQPRKYELRIVVWNTYDVTLMETSVVSRDKMSDLYVKGWLCGIDSVQETDVHYRSMDGEGNFNWRLVFPFEYLPTEGSIVVKKKEHLFSKRFIESHIPPRMSLQVWDNDMFSADDFIGSLNFDLTCIPRPAKSASDCCLKQGGFEKSDALYTLLKSKSEGKEGDDSVNIFRKKRLRGFWPFIAQNPEGESVLAGKIEMEMEIVEDEEISSRPVGKGRDEPNMHPTLEPPKRPATSFLWLTSPWKSFKFIIWRNYKWYIITVLLILLAVLLIILFIYSFPGAVVTRIVN